MIFTEKVSILTYMEIKKSEISRYRAAASRLAKLCRAPLTEGSLCRVARGGTERYQLTDKAAGKSRTLYVAKEDADEVRKWTENWKEAKKALREMSGIMREILRGNAAGGGSRKPRTSTDSPTRSSGTSEPGGTASRTS